MKNSNFLIIPILVILGILLAKINEAVSGAFFGSAITLMVLYFIENYAVKKKK